jgi:UDP-N-acetylmuramate--alanine ligase
MFWGQKPFIHLIGIGGSGMSGIAEVLLASGFPVSGSDLHKSATTERLQRLGAKIFEGHTAAHIENPTCVVVSSAISESNPEWREAKRRGISTIARAEMLAELMRLKLGIAIAGSHGKTTTTSMVGQVLRSLDPTVVVGGRLQHWNASSIVGKGSMFVIEADESDRSFLKFSPVYSVVTNIDREHLDTYRDLEDVEQTFLEYLNRTAFFGMNWVSADCPSLRKIRPQLTKPTQTYGLSESADLHIHSETFLRNGSQFSLSWRKRELGTFEIPVMGHHNVMNATAAIGIAMSCRLTVEEIALALRGFVPADRRLQIHEDNPVMAVVEDYGHHPTEIAATLDALKLMYPEQSISVFFQPHRYTRTQALFADFAKSFAGRCEEVFLLPIYGAHEKPRVGISSERLAETFVSQKVKVMSGTPTAEEVLNAIQKNSKKNVILILGAGPLTPLAVELAESIRSTSIMYAHALRKH